MRVRASPVGHPGNNIGGKMNQDTLRLLDCPRDPAVAVRETPHVAALPQDMPALEPTLERPWAAWHPRVQHTPSMTTACRGREFQGTPESHRSIQASHEAGCGSGSVVRSGRHLPGSEVGSQLARPHQALSLRTLAGKQGVFVHTVPACVPSV